MGARYMCGTLDIGDTRFNDVPFVPSQDCLHWEFCQEDAYKQGRSDQGELNADTVREIHELVYQQGIEKGRKEAIAEISREMRVLYGNDYEKQIRAEVLEEYKCKSCIHWRKYGDLKEACEVFDWQSKADDFCSFHELKGQKNG